MMHTNSPWVSHHANQAATTLTPAHVYPHHRWGTHVQGCCRFAALRTLDLSGIPKLQDGHLQGLNQLQLNCITLVGCEHITAAGLHHVGLAPGLTALDLTGCCKVPQAGSFPCHQCCSPYFAPPDVMLHGLIGGQRTKLGSHSPEGSWCKKSMTWCRLLAARLSGIALASVCAQQLLRSHGE